MIITRCHGPELYCFGLCAVLEFNYDFASSNIISWSETGRSGWPRPPGRGRQEEPAVCVRGEHRPVLQVRRQRVQGRRWYELHRAEGVGSDGRPLLSWAREQRCRSRIPCHCQGQPVVPQTTIPCCCIAIFCGNGVPLRHCRLPRGFPFFFLLLGRLV